jgi:hypothetical protein
MGMLSDDLAAIHADALALGMADSVTYNGTAITATIAESPEPYLGDEGGEVRRRTASLSCLRSDVAAPVKGDRVVVASGAYAGTWTVTDAGSADDGGWVLNIRVDDRAKMGGGRRLP